VNALRRLLNDREIRQLLRYGIVGVGSNGVLYLCYLFLTAHGVGPKTAMTMLYVIGVLQSFVFNRSWTFGHRGSVPVSLAKYAACYATGYLFNWAMLFLLVDRAGLPHRPVQAILVLATAVILYLLQRFWVFAPRQAGAAAQPRRQRSETP
jgi:putative flippase GtrA